MTIRLGILRYVVGSFLTKGSPMTSSTPGGIEIGVRPSLDGCEAVCEKCARLDGVCVCGWKSAGARKLGIVAVIGTVAAAALACTRRPLLGASMAISWMFACRLPRLSLYEGEAAATERRGLSMLLLAAVPADDDTEVRESSGQLDVMLALACTF